LGLTFLENPLFPLEGKNEEITLTQDELLKLGLLPLEGKTLREREAGEKKIAVVFWGPPNSGKTTGCSKYVEENYKDLFSSMVPVSYDEPILGQGKSGALFNIENYRTVYEKQAARALSGGEPDREALNEAYRKERSNSQRIRSYTINAAVEQGLDVCIDTTSASRGVFYMLDTLEKQGYEIHVVGMVSPLPVAEKRAQERLRLVEPDEVYSKREGAYGTFKELVEKRAAQAVLLYNPVNGQSPVTALRLRDGAVVEKNEAVCAEIAENVLSEAVSCKEKEISRPYADGLAKNGESFLSVVRAPVVPASYTKFSAPGNNFGS